MSDVNVELGESVQEGLSKSNKSKSNMSNFSNSQGDKSKSSCISGNSLYKFQKISHKEKIKKL